MKTFNLKWNNSRMPSISYDERFKSRQAEGVQFSNGLIALSNGVIFESLSEMEHHLKVHGTMEITFQEDAHVKAS